MDYSHLYVTYHTIFADLTRKYKHFDWDQGDVEIWCDDVVRRYIKDVAKMAVYEAIECPVNQETGMVKLPCNIFRLLDVYDNGGYLKYNRHGLEGHYLRLEGTSFPEVVCINYYGTPINKEGEYLIPKGYEVACETYSLKCMLEREMGTPQFQAQLWDTIDSKFSNLIREARANIFDFRDRMDVQKTLTIKANMIPKLGYMKLFNKSFD